LRPTRVGAKVALAAILLSGCVGTPDSATEDKFVGDWHLGLRVGDRLAYSWETPAGTFTFALEVGAPTTVRDPRGESRQAVPLSFDWSHDYRQVDFVAVESGKLALRLWKDFQPLSRLQFGVAGSPPWMLFGLDPARFIGQERAVVEFSADAGMRGVEFVVEPIQGFAGASPCVRLASREASDGRGFAWLDDPRPYRLTFCGGLPFPLSIESDSPSVSARLREATRGDGPLAFAYRAEAPAATKDIGAPLHPFERAVPPQGEPHELLSVDEAFEYAKENDAGFQSFLRRFPEARLVSHVPEGMGSTSAGLPGVVQRNVSQTAAVTQVYAAAGSRDGYEISVRKSYNELLARSQLAVTGSLATQAPVDGPANVQGGHVSIGDGFRWARETMVTEYEFSRVLAYTGLDTPLRDRYHYEYHFYGYTWPGAQNHPFTAFVFLDSRTGAVLLVFAHPEVVRKFVPAEG